MLKVGCCGFGRARAEYFRRLPVVEVQETFYQPPRRSTLQRWRADAPAGFEFTLKAWQPITHPAGSPTYRRLREPVERPEELGFFRPSDAVLSAWERTRAAAAALGARLVLFQCPASFTPSDGHVEQMRAFFARASRDGLTFLWEPRGDWPQRLIVELCRELDLVHVVDPFQARPLWGGFAYFRLHGVTGFRYRFRDDDLRRLAGWCGEHEDAYCLFNNVSMFEDALRLRALSRADG